MDLKKNKEKKKTHKFVEKEEEWFSVNMGIMVSQERFWELENSKLGQWSLCKNNHFVHSLLAQDLLPKFYFTHSCHREVSLNVTS